MSLMTLSHVARLLGLSHDSNQSITGVSVDSRLLEKGHLFFALLGDRTNGHFFLKEAVSKGALAVVVNKNYEGSSYGVPLLRVNDPLQSLQQIAQKVLLERKPRIVAITGSVGKTTTKEFITELLKGKYRVASSLGNSNSQIGLPLTILNHTQGCEEILVLEMGMNRPGEISKLVQIAPPEIAAIIEVDCVHAANFDSLADIAREKTEIFCHPKTRVGIHPIGSDELKCFYEKGCCLKRSFSTERSEGDYFLEDTGNELVLHSLSSEKAILPPLEVLGKHNKHNLLAAVAVARELHIGWDEIRLAIPRLKLPSRRLEFVKKKDVNFINDSYNAAPISMKSALESIPQPKHGGRKIAVLGSMLELGRYSVSSHKEIGQIALKHVCEVFCLGEECWPIFDVWKNVGRPAHLFLDRGELTAALFKAIQPNDIILLKGSKPKELWKILDDYDFRTAS